MPAILRHNCTRMTSDAGERKSRARRSLVSRTLRFLRRRLIAFSGPRVDSVQEIPEDRFLRLLNFQPAIAAQESAAGPDVPTLIRHLGHRVSEHWPPVPRVLTDLRLDMSTMTDAEIVERATDALSGDLHPSGVKPLTMEDGRIDWSSNPTKSREWLLMLHRHAWWALWGEAYQRTGDEKFAKAFIDQLTDWIDRHPLPQHKAEHVESWRLMEAGLRIRVSWLPAFACFFGSPSFNDSVKMKMLRALYDHGQFLSRFFTNRNHLVRESNGLLALALCFPEFDKSAEWLEQALQRLDRELQAQVNADGSHIEMSVGYQWLTIDEFEVTRSLLREHSLALPGADLDRTLGTMYAFLASVIRPDRTFPQLNDGFILWDAARLTTAGKETGLQDVEYIGSGGKTGRQPLFQSKSFPNAGIHVMRSDWSDNARYLIADTGPYGGPHGHEDKLSFELFAFGAPFVVDPGSYTYEKNDPYRAYFVGSHGHNTVLVDGKSQIRRWNQHHMTPAVQNGHHGVWSSGEEVDFASGRYDEGYAPFALTKTDDMRADFDVVHERNFIFVRPDYWVIVDYLRASEIHEYDFLFHLAPDVSVKELSDARALLRSGRNDTGLIIQSISDEALSARVVDGSEAPIQGWYSSDHHVKCAAPTVVFRASGSDTLCVAWLLYPLPSTASVGDIAVDRKADSEKDLLEFNLSRGQAIDSFSVPRQIPAGARSSGPNIVFRRDGRQRWSTGSVSVIGSE